MCNIKASLYIAILFYNVRVVLELKINYIGGKNDLCLTLYSNGFYGWKCSFTNQKCGILKMVFFIRENNLERSIHFKIITVSGVRFVWNAKAVFSWTSYIIYIVYYSIMIIELVFYFKFIVFIYFLLLIMSLTD